MGGRRTALENPGGGRRVEESLLGEDDCDEHGEGDEDGVPEVKSPDEGGGDSLCARRTTLPLLFLLYLR